jgi:hypothetical protein
VGQVTQMAGESCSAELAGARQPQMTARCHTGNELPIFCRSTAIGVFMT